MWLFRIIYNLIIQPALRVNFEPFASIWDWLNKAKTRPAAEDLGKVEETVPKKRKLTKNEKKARDRRRRIKKAGPIPRGLKHNILDRQQGCCNLCGRRVRFVDGSGTPPREEQATVDHIKPIRNGGKSTPSNLQVLCWPCHQVKDNRPAKRSRH